MKDLVETNGMLQEWGSRLFFPKPKKASASNEGSVAPAAWAVLSANAVRDHIRAAVLPRGRQVLVKLSGGGRGVLAVAAHMRYISRQGKREVGGRGETLELEDEQGNKIQGKAAIEALRDDWRFAGSYIPDESTRREAFNIILSMPEGTPGDAVVDAARSFARETFDGHKYVFVLHEDTSSPHVHLTVRTERSDGVRLNPRKADLATWRARFAARLQDRGIHAVATRGAAREGVARSQKLWRIQAAKEGRERRPSLKVTSQRATTVEPSTPNSELIASWQRVAEALETSARPEDRALALDVLQHVRQSFGTIASPETSRPSPASGDRLNLRAGAGEKNRPESERDR